MHFTDIDTALNEYKDGKTIIALYLYNSNFTEVPKDVFTITTLEALGLDDNNIQYLPKELSSLNQLVWLNIENNPLINPTYQLLQLFSNRTLIINDDVVTVNPNTLPLKVYL